MSREQLEKLADLASVDDDATRNERDAAYYARRNLKAGLSVPADVADILVRYQGKQLQQNRWGK